MADASFAVSNFLGGEISQFYQGRFDKSEYRFSMNVCLNAFAVEAGAWVRRPGSHFAGTTRGGAPGRVIKFDFEQAQPYTLEFTDGFLRFRNGVTLAKTNDSQVVTSISTANPAVVLLPAASTWVTGNTVMFSSPSAPLLENRQFIATKIDTTHFSLTDALTGATIDGSTLGALTARTTISRVQELVTVYVGGSWSTIRPVQAETTDILLCGTLPPQALTVPNLPVSGTDAVFQIGAATFDDGPYMDPFTNGVIANPGSGNGIVTLTLSFDAYVSTTSYTVGDFVTASSVNYESLIDQNVGNTPSSSPTAWSPVSAGAAINNGKGFLGTDIGRLVRMFTEPDLWNAATTYAAGTPVSYNPSGEPGAETYWQSLVSSNTGNIPGDDLTKWALLTGVVAYWTWGKITSLANIIAPNLAGSTDFGNMTANGGVAAAFDGVFSKAAASSALNFTVGGSVPVNTTVSLSCFVGKSYAGASNQQIVSATVYPSSDQGFSFGGYSGPFTGAHQFQPVVTLNLRASATPPTLPADGTLLGTTGAFQNQTGALTMNSGDAVTAWKYVWIEMEITAVIGTNDTDAYQLNGAVGQISYFSPTGSGVGSGDAINVELLGAGLGYIAPIRTWQLGVFSDTTGWPTCGTYFEGRLWLGGAIGNRWDASVANGIVGSTVNFAPTDKTGAVAASNAISYVLNSDSVNPIFWMQPDLQGVIMGTQAGEWLVQAPTAGPISPTNVAARPVTKIGCANIEPRRTEHTTVFVQRYSQKLMEYFADVFSGKFSAPNLADKAQHITRNGIAELAYVSAVTPIVWGRDGLGALFGMSYKRDTLMSSQGPTFNAWDRHALGSGRIVESICSGPSVGGNLDTLTMVTNDPTTQVRHVEVLTDTLDELSPLTAAWFVDDSLSPSSTSSSPTPVTGAPYGGLTLNGFWHLNGKTVSVFAGGLDCGDFAVANGSCFLPYGDGVSAGTGGGLFTSAYISSFNGSFPIAVGFTYTSQGQLVRPHMPADTGARNGPAFGKLRRIHRYALQLVNTLGLSVGTTFNQLIPASFKQPNNQVIAPLTMFSGVHQDSLKDDYTYDGMICWQISRPYPCTVVAIGGNLATQDQ